MTSGHPAPRHPYSQLGDGRQDQPTNQPDSPILKDTRLVLPGTQTLFGFQPIVVFTRRIQSNVSVIEQRWHLGAMAWIALAAALLFAPAAYHRQAEPRSISIRFVRLGNRLMIRSMAPLLCGIYIAFSLVASPITHHPSVSFLLACGLFATLVLHRLVLPRSPRWQDVVAN